MDAQLQSALRKIDTLILDIDHVLHHYDDQYARAFSTATAASFWKLYPNLQQTETHMHWIDFSVESYMRRGKTTALFKERFPQINEMKLYVHHHDYLCKEGGFIHQEFIQGKIQIDPELAPLLETVKKTGVKIVAVTNGTQGYGEMILGVRDYNPGHRISHLFDRIMGVDSVENPHVNDKRHGIFWSDTLDSLNVLKRFNNASGHGFEDFDHSHIALVDDTARNLRAPSKLFGMHTTLKLTDHNRGQTEHACHSVEDVKDFLKQIIEAKSTLVQRLRLVNG